MRHSPRPWRLVPSSTPYATWIADAEHGCVCIGFSNTDAPILLHAAALFHAVEDAAVAMGAGRIVRARQILEDALTALERTQP